MPPPPDRMRRITIISLVSTVLVGAAIALIVVFAGGDDEPDRGTLVRDRFYTENGLTWPLTVDHGYVDCRGPALVFTAPDGIAYALNGTGQSTYPAIDPIWAPDPEVDGLRLDLRSLLQAAQLEC